MTQTQQHRMGRAKIPASGHGQDEGAPAPALPIIITNILNHEKLQKPADICNPSPGGLRGALRAGGVPGGGTSVGAAGGRALGEVFPCSKQAPGL